MTAYETTLGHHKTNWVSMAPRPGPQMWGWPPEKNEKKHMEQWNFIWWLKCQNLAMKKFGIESQDVTSIAEKDHLPLGQLLNGSIIAGRNLKRT